MPTTTSVLPDLHHEVRGTGPSELFITGASGDAGHFARAAERLADEFTTVAYDRCGCSRSARLPDEVMSIRAQADDAVALIEELDLAPAIAFGTSGGGDILLELIARRPAVLRFFAQELQAFGTYVPDVERIHAAGIPLELLVSREGVPFLIAATERLAGELGIEVESISGHHAPYLRDPEAFAEELRPILRELG
jgi:pimeloyl-ACP methyl ester carboxylesterase